MERIFKVNRVNTGIDLGIDYLTTNLAYFLGGICIGDRTVINDNEYFLSLLRHNPKQATALQLEEHYNNIKKIAESINKEDFVYMHDYFKNENIDLRSSDSNNKIFGQGKEGIITLFNVLNDEYSKEDFINDIRESLLTSDEDIRRAFIIGVFDCKGAYDRSNLIAVDYTSDTVGDLICDVLETLDVDFNNNNGAAARARASLTARPRAAQIRLNYKTYLNRFGYISTYKLEHSLSKVNIHQYSITRDNLLTGLNIVNFTNDI
ncbi:hypothetical protein [Clostridium saudiense]|uniref:hypothetical protein n=1 Tax=Clostridium saudiense TaxID=1414720 RepID=UPI0018A9A880|nr:hypothetical protein [Clostridium saudiense]